MAQHNPEQWRSEPPTVAGLYWAWDGEEVWPVDVYECGRVNGAAQYVGFELGDNYDLTRPLTDYTHWIGPLPEPEPPTNAA